MSNVYIEREDDKYVALRNKKIIAKAETQAEAIDRAKKIRPEDAILVERVRMTKSGSRDKWRSV